MTEERTVEVLEPVAIDEGRTKFDRRLATELVEASEHIHLLELRLAQSDAALDATYRVLFSILIISVIFYLIRVGPSPVPKT